MKQLFTTVLAGFLLLAAAPACTKHVAEEGGGATIAFRAPTAGAMYHNGDTVTIDAQINGMAPLHGYEVWIRKSGDTTTYFHQQVHDHSQTIHAVHKWKNTLNSSMDLEAILRVTVDHDGNVVTAKVPFVVM